MGYRRSDEKGKETGPAFCSQLNCVFVQSRKKEALETVGLHVEGECG